jgi:hypothetical protein
MINPQPKQRYLYQDSWRELVCEIISPHYTGKYKTKIEPNRYNIKILASLKELNITAPYYTVGTIYTWDSPAANEGWKYLPNQDRTE